jgi:hypothetical protein
MNRKFTDDAGHALGYIYDCSLRLALTNTSHNLIQIAGVGVQLTGSTHQNDYQYHLIDPCTLPNLACGFGASETPCDQYFATIKLGLNSTSTVLSATPVGRAGPSCGELTLNPGGVKALYVYFYSPSNLIYSVVPQLILDTSNGKNTLQLPQLMSRLAFAKGSQFTCYGLRGDTFVVEKEVPPNSYCL